MSYDVITHEKLDAVIAVLKDIRAALEANTTVVQDTSQQTITAEKLEIIDTLVVKKAGKKKGAEYE